MHANRLQVVVAGLATAALGCAAAGPCTSRLINPFGDPFVRVSADVGACMAPAPPMYTAQEMRAEEHWRVEQGNSCYLAGRCVHPSSFGYDAGIARRLVPRLRAAAGGSSVWMLVQGRVVQLQGCVSGARQAHALAAIARGDRAVQAVLTQLSIGAGGSPPYPPAEPCKPR